MDPATIAAYDRSAASIAEAHARMSPSRLLTLIEAYFPKGANVLDIGCGSGRDTAWLAAAGFSARGIDASQGMTKEARRRHPDLSFTIDTLPDLPKTPSDSADAILCSAALMHLSEGAIPAALAALLRVLRPGGILILSWRGTAAADAREGEKLYTPIDPETVVGRLTSSRATVLHREQCIEPRRGHLWYTLVAQKIAVPC